MTFVSCPPTKLAEVVDLVARLRDGAGGDEVGLDEMIEVGLDAASHGDMVDGPAALAQLRAKYGLPDRG